MSDYAFRTTSKLDQDTYLEDRGFLHVVRREDADFQFVDYKFGTMLNPGQTAQRSSGEDDWEVIDGIPAMEYAKTEKLKELNAKWLEAEENGIIYSISAGFQIDANERANRDISGLITAMEFSGKSSVTFCDAFNEFHDVNLNQLKAMQIEIIQHAQNLYARKWQIRTAIGEASTPDELNSIEIDFSNL